MFKVSVLGVNRLGFGPLRFGLSGISDSFGFGLVLEGLAD